MVGRRAAGPGGGFYLVRGGSAGATLPRESSTTRGDCSGQRSHGGDKYGCRARRWSVAGPWHSGGSANVVAV